MGIVFLIIIIVIAIIAITSNRKVKTRLPTPAASTRPPSQTNATRPPAPRPTQPTLSRPSYRPPTTTPVAHDAVSLAAAGDAAWVPAGQSVTIGEFTINGGLLYVGGGLTGASTRSADPALVDPRLPVDARRPDYAGAFMGYWPSYSEIKPACRGGYLHWLSDGRHDPDAYIGYVFLYFYGLERRLLVDAQHSTAAQAEYPELIAEVQRLLGIYAQNHSFRSYAERLLAVATPQGDTPRYSSPPPQAQRSWELPFDLRLGLGQLVADGKAIPAEWALAWLRLHPETRLRTPATRCPAEFAEVFAQLYQKTYGEGMVVKPNRTMLGGSYVPASAGFAGQIARITSSVPDVTTLSAPVAKLRELGEQACTDLDAYSRYLGRHPSAAGSAPALALLPSGIARPADAAARALLSWAQDSLSDSDHVDVGGAELIARWPNAEDGRLPKPEAVLLAQLLEREGLGVEPDVRFGGATPTAATRVVLFRRAAHPVSTPSAGYSAAAAITQLAAVVALADGAAADVETNAVTAHLTSAFDLVEDEQYRLRALLAHVLAHPLTPAALRKRAAALTDQQRRDAGQLLIAVAVADGVVTPDEIDALTRLFTALGLDPTSVYRDVHALATTGDELTPMRTAGEPAGTFALPPKPGADAPERRAVALDPKLVAARLADSARAATYLAEIFTDDDPAPAAPPVPAQPVKKGISVAGLDASHTALLHRLAERPEWVRAEFESLTAELGLLPDGALDMLNEAAVDAAGEPVCEGSDPIEINNYAVEEMLR
jgi:tellurite resistance protein